MKRIRIIHNTQYHYRQPVKFGPHRAMLRPREGHDVHIVKSRLDIGPPATLRWLRDIYGNSIAVIDFQEAARTLSILSEVDVDLYDDNPIECLIEPTARLWFGLITVIAIEIGLLTPPLGVSVFVVKANLEDQSITTWQIFKGTLPMTLTMAVVLIVCVLFPRLSLLLIGQKWSWW